MTKTPLNPTALGIASRLWHLAGCKVQTVLSLAHGLASSDCVAIKSQIQMAGRGSGKDKQDRALSLGKFAGGQT